MIWIRIFVMVFVALMAIYYAMLILQCMTNWFKFTNRDITFGRCIVPFYYWIASVDEKKKETYSDYSDEYEDQIKEDRNNKN